MGDSLDRYFQLKDRNDSKSTSVLTKSIKLEKLILRKVELLNNVIETNKGREDNKSKEIVKTASQRLLFFLEQV